MEQDDPHSDQIYSYLALRNSLGWIGILLPFVLMFGYIIVFDGDSIQSSISHYYCTPMHDVFVGALCAIALFLFFYKGYDYQDFWTAKIAGFCAVCVAWFPGKECEPLKIIWIIHLISATIFFLTLAYISLFLFSKTNTGRSPTLRKLARNKIYKLCGIIMIVCLVAILIFSLFVKVSDKDSCFIFWAETIALIAFGVSWITKGGTLLADKKEVAER